MTSQWRRSLLLPTGGFKKGAELFDGSIDSVARTLQGIGKVHGMSAPRRAAPLTLPLLRRAVQAVRRYPGRFGGLIDSLQLVAPSALLLPASFEGVSTRAAGLATISLRHTKTP